MARDLTKFGLYIIVLLVILTLYSRLFGQLPFSINSTESNVFTVTGEGKVEVVPDLATVSAGVSATGSTVREVQDKMNSSINKISDAIKDLGIDSKDIQTSNYNINPTYGETQRITGYSANTNLTIKVREIDKTNLVIDAATNAGATNVASLGFDNSETSVFEEKARKEAIENAKKKAQETAKTAGFNLGKIVNYAESTGGGIPQPLSIESPGRGDLKTQLEPGTNEIIVNVTLSYEIR